MASYMAPRTPLPPSLAAALAEAEGMQDVGRVLAPVAVAAHERAEVYVFNARLTGRLQA